MIVTFVSQCEKYALKRTRRVLDAFANRIGDNTWQTLITAEGLETVKKMLRKSASRSTAVSCHWIRSRSRTQLLWVVGNRKKFNSEGYVPVNRTEKSFLGREHENDWQYLSLIEAFTKLAALLHDWGKASRLFQDKLNPEIKTPFKGDPVRHEWVSSILFSALVKSQPNSENDENWLDILSTQQWDESQLQQWAKQNQQAALPLSGLPDAASLLTWLILSHHRLPFLDVKQQQGDAKNGDRLLLSQIGHKEANTLADMMTFIKQYWGYENKYNEQEFNQRLGMCFEFPNGLLSTSPIWTQAIKQAAIHLKQQLPLFQQAMADGSWKIIAHYARLCLMLGDHNYSSKENDPQWKSDIPLYANTHYVKENPLNKGMQFKQKLDEHLVKVAEIARDVAEQLPFFEGEPPTAGEVKKLTHQKNSTGPFSWQEDVVSTIHKYREQQDDIKGYFIVNMASTGCGKTRANAKVMQALSEDKQSLRFILALGLRTLTLQTGDEYKDSIGLEEDELAVLVGSKAVTQLHYHAADADNSAKDDDNAENKTKPQDIGSESQETLFDDDEEVLLWQEDKWQGALPEEALSTVLTRAKDRALLYAPVLACTIDHIMGATETTRGGRYILPSLRLMSSDLVIDEVDDFSDDDLIAIGRLIHFAGLLGRKVMISSATIPPDTALAYFHAYQSGWYIHAKSRQQPLQIGCIWMDEGKYNSAKDQCQATTQIATITANDVNSVYLYQQYHDQFVDKRAEVLQSLPARRKALIAPMPIEQGKNSQKRFFEHIQAAILTQHEHHHFVDQQTGIQLSFGVVRVANISPCVELTRFLLECEWPENIEIRTMAYHSRQVLLLRHEQEQHLDKVLKRKEKMGEQPIALADPIIRQHLTETQGKAKNLIFILVATPVEEVGRDHDFDWAVVEPSSYRSIIQVSGRVRRHREGEVEQPNVSLLQYNWKGFQGKEKYVFVRPGYENSAIKLKTHNLSELVDEQQLRKSINSLPRIKKPTNVEGTKSCNFASLEHASISYTLKTNCLFPTEQVEKTVKTHQRRRSRANSSAMVRVNTASHLWGYTHGCWWMTAIPVQLAPFRKNSLSIRLSLVISNRGKPEFWEYDRVSGWVTKDSVSGVQYVDFPESLKKKLWLVRDYQQSIYQHSQDEGQLTSISRLYGEVSFLKRDNDNHNYQYDDQMGIYEVER
ncbi:type I-F CRISPR-associated helicase Cas3f [Providencia stuartii]|uniref:type I-F CRISPR-associated helicase Cas3f n=1 Tax=Providencia stuartii TaxID=588 RepID=UPI00300D2F1C